jgi:hypothetical protein
VSAPRDVLDRLDHRDPAAFLAWLADLRLAFDHADAVTRDTLRRPRRRELGPVLARANYRDARQRITSLLTFADPVPPEGPPEGPPGGPPAAPAPPADPAPPAYHEVDLPRRRTGEPPWRCDALPT